MCLHAYTSGHASVQSFMYQLIKGTAHCHKHGVMHRDLKPQNLLVDDDTECLKIADLGLGRAFSIPIKSYTHEVGPIFTYMLQSVAEMAWKLFGFGLMARLVPSIYNTLHD